MTAADDRSAARAYKEAVFDGLNRTELEEHRIEAAYIDGAAYGRAEERAQIAPVYQIDEDEHVEMIQCSNCARLEAALRRIDDRAQRIMRGEVETTAIGAADYDHQVVSEALAAAAPATEQQGED